MIGRFRDEGISRQAATTAVAGFLIGICWLLRWFAPNPLVETALALAATALCGGPIIYEAVRGVWARQVNVDELVTLAILAALVAGEYLAAATVSFIMVLGSLLESFTSARAQRAIEALVELTPETVRLLTGSGESVVPVEEARPGQKALVKPGEKIPVDGIVLEGRASVDQSSVTGEPIPVDAEPGTRVFAGTFVHGGALTLEITRVGEDSTLGKIVSLVRDAELHQARIVRSADRFAKWFTPAILVIATLAWLLTGDFMRAVAVLVVGCPCALILATPTAVVAAMGAAARRGIIIKGGRFLEALADVDAVVFDKTGTLTAGRPDLRSIHCMNGASSQEVLRWCAAVEQNSEHPLAAALVQAARREEIPLCAVADFESTPGVGVRGNVEGICIRIGRDPGAGTAPAISEGDTVLWVHRDEDCVAAITLGDEVRPSAAPAVRDLKALGIRSLHLLSGDRAETVARLAREVGIESWHGALLPHEKVERLRELQAEGRRIMYVGDGVNDGPALATSHVGVAMGSGASPLALEAAPIALLHADVGQIPTLIRLGRTTKRRIMENLLVFAVMFNAIAIALASAGVLSPIAAAVTHNVGSVAVVLNSARLIRFKGGRG
ncbi:cadmium-translocating P-type ATPase [bacterium]|nr:cadmium-translocating P-type ATPase [bacterium]